MIEDDPKILSKVAGKRTALLTRLRDPHSPTAVPESDPAGSSVDGPAPRVGHGGGHRTMPGPPAWNRPTQAPPNNTSRPGAPTGLSGWFGALRRMFRRGRVAPLRTRAPDPLGPTPAASPARGPPTVDGDPASTSVSRGGSGPWAKTRWSACLRTSRSENIPTTAKSSGLPRKKGNRALRSNRVAPSAAAHRAVMPSRRLGMHKTTVVGDLAALAETPGDTRLPDKSSPMRLTRLAGLFTCCTGKRSCQTPAKPRAVQSPRNAREVREHGDEAAAPAGRTAGEVAGCCPCARPVVAVAPATPRMFWVGSRDGSEDTDTSVGDDMGHALHTGRANSLQEQDNRNLKTIAHKQTVVTEDDIRRTALEVRQHSSSKRQSQTSPEPDDEDILTGVPSINENHLRPVCKEPGRPTILGRGQSGVVRLVRLRRPGGRSSLVAVKRLMLGTCSGPLPAMVREIRALQAMDNCPIFPKLVGVITKQTFAQEFIGNPKSLVTLSVFKAFRGKPPISVEHWVLIIRDVITGLSALHQSGWAHCDIQSNNVLLWRDRSQSDPTEARWQGRIIDLGNAKRLSGPDTYCLDLTPSEKEAYYRDCRHIPAEIVEGLVPYGVGSDTYSVGVLMTDIAHQVPGMLELARLADTCTVANPDERPTLRALLKELNAWCRDHTGFRFSPVEREWMVAYV